MIQTEFAFELPKGYVDGPDVHRRGTMRLATAGDEILPLRDPRCQGNDAYLIVILLSRVITKLGTLGGPQITTKVIEDLFREDMAYLQEFYNRINGVGVATIPARCPACGHAFDAGLDPAGG